MVAVTEVTGQLPLILAAVEAVLHLSEDSGRDESRTGARFSCSYLFSLRSSTAVHPLTNERLHPRRDYLSLYQYVKGPLRLTPMTLLASKQMSQLGG